MCCSVKKKKKEKEKGAGTNGACANDEVCLEAHAGGCRARRVGCVGGGGEYNSTQGHQSFVSGAVCVERDRALLPVPDTHTQVRVAV